MKLRRWPLLICLPLLAAPAAGQDAPRDPVSEADLLDQKLAGAVSRERTLQQRLEALTEESRELDARLVLRGRAYVRWTKLGLLPMSGGFEALVSHAARVERLRRALARDAARQKRLLAERVGLSRELEDVKSRRTSLEVQQQAMARARTALLAAQDRALAFERAFSTSSSPSHATVYGAEVGPADVTSGFASLRGRLPFPIAGRNEVRSAQRASADGPGVELSAPLGAAVRAVAAGRVAFADEYADYGKTVIIDHGARHYTVSANLRDISARVGDEVTSGTRLGSVGDSPQGPCLYFEVRVGTETADPAEWFGLQARR